MGKVTDSTYALATAIGSGDTIVGSQSSAVRRFPASLFASKVVLNVIDYGAKGDTRKYADGAITTGTATFTSATATFTTADVGKTITVGGAGAAGAMLVTTISAFTNGTTVTLGTNAGTTVSGKNFGFGTNNTTAIQNAVNDANAQPNGGVVVFPPGIFGIANEVTHKLNVVIVGAGMDASVVYLLGDEKTIFIEPNVGTPTNSFMGMEDITLWGPMDRNATQDVTAGTLGAGNRLSTMRADRVWWRRVHGIYSRQMSLTGVGAYEGRAENCVVEKGGRDGINLTGSKTAIFSDNSLSELPDDGIAFHIIAGLAVGTIASPTCTVTGNRFYKCSGVKILGGTNATITGNAGRFMLGYGVYMDYDKTFGEGNKDTLGVIVSNNSFMDIINLNPITAGVQSIGDGIFVASPPPDQGTGLGRTVANGTTTAASANLTSATIAWTSADIGKSVTVTGAGPAGALLTSRIMSITSGTVAVMENTASTSVTTSATITLSSLAYMPATTMPGTGTVAIKGPSTNAWNGVSGAATGAFGLVITNNTIINTLDGKKTDGTNAVNFSDYGFGTLWWTSGAQDFAIASNMGNTVTAYDYRGVLLKDGGARDVLVANNSIYGMKSGVVLVGTTVRPSALIQGNKIYRCNRGVSLEYTAAATYMQVLIRDNSFDLDPLFESTERTAAASQPTGTWTRAAGNTAVVVYSYQAYGVTILRNAVRNACNLSTGNTEGVVFYDNILYLDSTVTAPSFGGVGATNPELVTSRVIQEISDPRLTTYSQFATNNSPGSGTAMPTTGTWAKGTVVVNETPSYSGGFVVSGWLRLTSGTANVAGTDWAVMSTGEPSANAVSTPAAGFASDTLLTGSVVAIPAGLPTVGTTYKLRFYVAKTNVGTATPIINVRIGTAGTAADTSRLTFTFGAGTTAADEGLFEVMATFRTVGATTTAVISGYAVLTNNLQTTGLSNGIKAKTVTSSGFDSTVANLKISASYNGGTSAAHTVSFVRAELAPS